MIVVVHPELFGQTFLAHANGSAALSQADSFHWSPRDAPFTCPSETVTQIAG